MLSALYIILFSVNICHFKFQFMSQIKNTSNIVSYELLSKEA